VAIVLTIVVEMIRRPKLRLEIAAPGEATYPHDRPAKTSRYLAVTLVNLPLPFLFRWMSRAAALQCRGTITFHNLDGERYFVDEMPLRFARSPEPVPMQIALGGVTGILVDPLRLSLDSRVDVFPGESTPIDVAVRYDSEDDCYAWSNMNYFCTPPWRHPDWKLPPGRYLVQVTVQSSGEKCVGLFRLLNQGGRKDFRLEKASQSDRVR
jgi:hypothetical protein